MSQTDCLRQEDNVRKTIENCLTAQAMIDINAKHLEGLRTECAITAELTQNEIRTLEVIVQKVKVSINLYCICRQNWSNSSVGNWCPNES